jgi:hypothetical protein
VPLLTITRRIQKLEVLAGIGRILYGGITLKAECDNWSSHTDDFKSTVIAQFFFGTLLALVAIWAYRTFPAGSSGATVPALVFFGFLGVCWALNSYRNLNEKSFVSQNFSEFWLFGFFKGDDYLAGLLWGWLVAGLCLWGIYSSVVLHENVLVSAGRNSTNDSASASNTKCTSRRSVIATRVRSASLSNAHHAVHAVGVKHAAVQSIDSGAAHSGAKRSAANHNATAEHRGAKAPHIGAKAPHIGAKAPHIGAAHS